MIERENMADTAIEQVSGIFSLQLFTPEQCRTIIDEAEHLNTWVPGKIQGSREGDDITWVVSPEIRDALIMGLHELPVTSKLFDDKIRSTVLPLVNRRWKMALADHSGAQVIRYTPGGHYKPHIDNEPGIDDRHFSIVCYLNDDVEGGSTDFPLLGFSASPRTGKAIIFPSEYLHCSRPIISGRKYILVTWLIGSIPVSWI